MINDLLYIGHDIRTVMDKLKRLSTFDRVHLSELLEHIGIVLIDIGNKLCKGHLPDKSRQIELLSEELYFKLAFVAAELKAQSSSKRLMETKRTNLLSNEITNEFGEKERAQFNEAASHFLDTSKFLRMN